MPDLRSEISKVLSAWEQEEQKFLKQQTQEKQVQKTLPQLFKTTNNVSRETFNYVRDNPNKTSGEIRAELAKRGFNSGSVGSLITQYLKQHQMVKSDAGGYRTIVPAHAPLKAWATLLNQRATKKFKAEVLAQMTMEPSKLVNKSVSIKRKQKSQGIAALRVDAIPPENRQTLDVDTMLNTMNIVQARTMYDALKNIFGG